MKFSIKDVFNKCDQIHRKLRIWSHLLKKSLMENFYFLCSVTVCYLFVHYGALLPYFAISFTFFSCLNLVILHFLHDASYRYGSLVGIFSILFRLRSSIVLRVPLLSGFFFLLFILHSFMLHYQS